MHMTARYINMYMKMQVRCAEKGLWTPYTPLPPYNSVYHLGHCPSLLLWVTELHLDSRRGHIDDGLGFSASVVGHQKCLDHVGRQNASLPDAPSQLDVAQAQGLSQGSRGHHFLPRVYRVLIRFSLSIRCSPRSSKLRYGQECFCGGKLLPCAFGLR